MYILNVLKNLRTVSDLIAKSEKFYAKSDLTKLSWSLRVLLVGFLAVGRSGMVVSCVVLIKNHRYQLRALDDDNDNVFEEPAEVFDIQFLQ